MLLVDTGTTGWAVRYANSGYTDLVQRHMQSQATQSWVDAAAAADPSVSQPLVLPAGATTAAAAQAQGAGGDSGGVEGNQHLSAGVLEGAVGFLLFPVIMQQLAQEPDGGSSMLQQMQQLVASRQPFSLHGLRMHGFGDTTISLVFRCAFFLSTELARTTACRQQLLLLITLALVWTHSLALWWLCDMAAAVAGLLA